MITSSIKYYLVLATLLPVGLLVAGLFADRIEPHSDHQHSHLRQVSRKCGEEPDITEDWCITQAGVFGHSFKWAISDFSLRDEKMGESLNSSTFPAGPDHKFKWQLSVFPRGMRNSSKDFVSIMLQLLSVSESVAQPIRASFYISIINNKNEKIHTRGTNLTSKFFIAGSWGYDNFIERVKLLDPKQKLLSGDELTIWCEVKVLSGTKKYSGQVNQRPINRCTFPEDLGRMFESEMFSDVSFVVDGQEFKAHKAIVAARSPVFRALLSQDMQEGQFGRIGLTDVEPQVFHQVLRFIYTGEASFEQTSTNDDDDDDEANQNNTSKSHFTMKLFKAAARYQLEGLMVLCEDRLYDRLSVESVIETLSLADQYKAVWLKNQAIQFAKTHTAEITEIGGWKLLAKHDPELVAELFARQSPARPSAEVN